MVQTKVLLSENSRTALLSSPSSSPSNQFHQYLASLFVSLSAFCIGTCLAWTSSALSLLEITDQNGAWIGSLLTLGAFIGALPAGLITNLIGRKTTLLLLAVPIFISWILISYFCDSIEILFIARFLLGFCCGGISVAAPMYVAEIADSSRRGALGTFFQVFITVGALTEYVLGSLFSSFSHLALASSLFPLIFLLTFSFMPETPIYLYTKGKIDEAGKSLQFFRGTHFNIDAELLRIANDVKETTENKISLWEFFHMEVTRNALIISIGLMAFQQLSGVNAVIFYSADIFRNAGSPQSPAVCAIIIGFIQVIATLVSTLLIDKAGRKILLVFSSFIMSLSLIALGGYFYLKDYQDLTYLNWIPLISLCCFIIMFSIGLGPIPWVIVGEIFTSKTKGPASSISASVNWLLAFVVTNQFHSLISAIGPGFTFISFGCICVLAGLFVILLLPETKGKDNEDVQKLLIKSAILN